MFVITYLLTSKWHPVDDYTTLMLAMFDTLLILGVAAIVFGGEILA